MSTRKISSSPSIQLPCVKAGDARGSQLVGVQVEADVSRGGVPRNVEFIDLEREYRDVIVVWLVAHRGTRSTISLRPEVGHSLRASTRRISSVASAVSEARGRCGNVVHDPMPPSAAGWCVRIVHRDGEGPRSCWRI